MFARWLKKENCLLMFQYNLITPPLNQLISILIEIKEK